MTNDPITAPLHYAGDGIEAKDAMRSMMAYAEVMPIQAYWWGNAMKYLWRWPHKGGVQDLMKCKQCIDYLIGENDGKITA